MAHEGHGESNSAHIMVVAAVVPGGAAAGAGLLEGDRILTWDGEELRTQAELDAFLKVRRPGDPVPLEVERQGETLSLSLTLGDSGTGRPSLGISIGLAPPTATGDSVTSDACRTWLTETYQIGSLAAELGLDLDETIARIDACVDRDLARMPPSIPRGWCDNVFKVHCSGLDLLAEIGDAVVARCTRQLGDLLGVGVVSDKTWNVCGEQRVFDGYSIEGRVSDVAECRRILVEECGAAIAGSGNR